MSLLINSSYHILAAFVPHFYTPATRDHGGSIVPILGPDQGMRGWTSPFVLGKYQTWHAHTSLQSHINTVSAELTRFTWHIQNVCDCGALYNVHWTETVVLIKDKIHHLIVTYLLYLFYICCSHSRSRWSQSQQMDMQCHVQLSPSVAHSAPTHYPQFGSLIIPTFKQLVKYHPNIIYPQRYTS